MKLEMGRKIMLLRWGAIYVEKGFRDAIHVQWKLCIGITVDNHIVIKFSIFRYVIYDNDIK